MRRSRVRLTNGELIRVLATVPFVALPVMGATGSVEIGIIAAVIVNFAIDITDLPF